MTETLRVHARNFRRLLVERAIPAWCRTADDDFGGYRVGLAEADRSSHHLVATARLLWTFSHVLRHGLSSDAEVERAARLGFRCLVETLRDAKHGGFHWRILGDGGTSDSNKYLYGQAFAIYGLVEYHRATGEDEALALAKETFALVMERAHDRKHGGWLEHFDAAWRPLPRGRANPVELTGLKSGNAHLHWMEALTELAMATSSDAGRQALAESIDVIRRYFYPPAGWRMTAWRTPEWKRFRAWRDGVGYGHLVERAWLVLRAEQALGVQPSWDELDRILDWVTKVAVDERDGSLLAYGNALGGIRERSRIWWVQAEYLVALGAAVRHDPAAHRIAALERLLDWLASRQIDQTDGLWQSRVSAAGDCEAQSKHGPWKAGYHEVRAMATFVRDFGSEPGRTSVILEP